MTISYEVVKDILVPVGIGIVGFGGVIITLLYNAALDRQRHDREVKHQRDIVRTALLAELRRNLEHFQEGMTAIQKATDRKSCILLPVKPLCEVYDLYVERIGVLTSEQVRSTMAAYAYIKSRTDRMSVVSVLTYGDAPPIAHGQLEIRTGILDVLKAYDENSIRHIRQALDSLDGVPTKDSPTASTGSSGNN